MADCEHALKLDSRSAIALHTRGKVWLQKGDLVRTLADFDKAVIINPHEAYLLCSRGLVLIQMNRLEEAERDCARCRELGGTLTPEAEQLLQRARQQRNPKQ